MFMYMYLCTHAQIIPHLYMERERYTHWKHIGGVYILTPYPVVDSIHCHCNKMLLSQ